MKVDYIKLDEYKVKFKQLISGPAPVGRILNYLILTGKGVLRHKNGNRDLYLNDNVASAWCSEFMVGLGLIYYVEESGKTTYPLQLTENGKQLYALIKDFPDKFNEDVDPTQCYNQLHGYSESAYNLFFRIFTSSPICINLCKYIQNAATNSFLKSTFKDDYFECFKILYEGGVYNRAARTTTGANRVPSLLQLCKFFYCLKETSTHFIFDYEALCKHNDSIVFIPIDSKKITELSKEDTKNEKIINDLIEKYGINGTVAREIVTRNSSVQELFRNNLIAKYGCKCAICDKKIESILIASHIVPSSESNVIEKADCENGLLLCSLHDKLFDRYLISFDFNTGKLIYAEPLKGQLVEYQLSEDLTLEERFMTDERKDYLMKHNMAFYERNK